MLRTRFLFSKSMEETKHHKGDCDFDFEWNSHLELIEYGGRHDEIVVDKSRESAFETQIMSVLSELVVNGPRKAVDRMIAVF